MLDLDKFGQQLTAHNEAFEREVKKLYSPHVLPHWRSELHGFPQTLYGYMMAFFLVLTYCPHIGKVMQHQGIKRLA